MEIREENSLKIVVERRKFTCYLCSKRGHVRIQCPRYKSPQMGKEVEETNLENINDTECSREVKGVGEKRTIEKSEEGVSAKRS